MKDQLRVYKKMPIWNKHSFPDGFKNKHSTKPGTWARLTILSGELTYYALNEKGDVLEKHIFSSKNLPPPIEPQAWHRVEAKTEDLEFYMEFLCRAESYFEKKYNLSATHSEVKSVLEFIKSGSALELGCGRGHNSLYLQSKGFQVEAIDANQESISELNTIIDTEQIGEKIRAKVGSIEHGLPNGSFDLVLSIVAFQFLPQTAITGVIKNMKSVTKPEGLNLIVAPMSTEEAPCPIDFSELKSYYQDWKVLKYDESMGSFRSKDESGDQYQVKLATIIAQKPKW